ncbi:MAG: radical SAM protein [Candidatus Omnitrophica bacterium]|nr:radical SAM protein [Candidatus Omnitrophota bacterium]
MNTYNLHLINKAKERTADFQRLKAKGLLCLDGDFFPSVHYPPITMYPPISEEGLFKSYTLPKDGLFDVYVHIPFCIRYCTFCHYPVKTGDLHEEKEKYLQALKKEMDIFMRRFGLKTIKARSILIGGGTPTYLTPAQLESFLKFFRERVDISKCTQFSYDVDPPTLIGDEGNRRLKIMRDSGVNRLTIGVQSLDDGILKMMNRPHDAKDAIRAVNDSREHGFKLNIEFIFGYPGQSYEDWIKVMNKAISLQTEEIQLYRLKVIPYGDHQGFVQKKFFDNPDEFLEPETAITMKELAILILEENGYKENLRRVFTKKREDYSHYADNQCCKLYDEVGFGLTAFSSLRDRFGLNTQDFQEYYSMIDQEKLPLNRGLVRNEDDQLRWCIILPLKNREVLKKFFKMQTGVSLDQVFRKKIERLKENGLLHEDDKMLSLTKLGAFFADEVCQQFHRPDYMPYPQQAYAQGELNPYFDCNP